MVDEPGIVVLSPIRVLLTGGGLPLLAFGLVMSLWGIWNIWQPRSIRSLLSQLAFSVLPGMIAVVVIYLSCQELGRMAVLSTPPKPSELAATAGRAFSFGFVGLLSTIVPVMLSVVAIRRYCVITVRANGNAE